MARIKLISMEANVRTSVIITLLIQSEVDKLAGLTATATSNAPPRAYWTTVDERKLKSMS